MTDDKTRYLFDGHELSATTFLFDLDFGALVQVRGTRVSDRVMLADSVLYVDP